MPQSDKVTNLAINCIGHLALSYYYNFNKKRMAFIRVRKYNYYREFK
jgi:hypothetical protein